MTYKILIIAPKYNEGEGKNYNYHFPLGLAHISSILKKFGYYVDCLNLNHRDGSNPELITRALDKKDYDFVLTGGITMNYWRVKRIIDSIKKHESKPRTILGGTVITSEPEIIFKSIK